MFPLKEFLFQNKKWLILIGIILLILLLIKMGTEWMGGSASSLYKTVKVERGDIRMTVSATGSLDALTTVEVGSQISGIIQDIYVDFNSPVKKDQVIAQIDPSLFDAALAREKANLKSAEAEVINKKRDLSRLRQLVEKDLVSQSEVDNMRMQYEQAVAAKSLFEAAIKSAETNLRYCTILSPVDGIVISRDVDVGQTVAASFQAPTLFTIAQDLKEMEIKTQVDEADIGMIQEGQKVLFTVDAFPNEVFAGKVTQVRNSPVIVQNVVHYDVIVSVNNEDLKLKPGMTAHVKIISIEKKDILRVPNAALRFTPEGYAPDQYRRRMLVGEDAQGGKVYEATVWTLQFQKPAPRKIKVGFRDEFFTEVIEGLKQNEAVIIAEIPRGQKQSQKINPLVKTGRF